VKITKTIRRVLLERETTGAQLAGRLGVTPSNISQKMIRDNWSVSDLAAIAAALGCGFSVSFHLPDGQTMTAEQPAPAEQPEQTTPTT
jgi:transcriptional regulator with XRE-family HTH domain